MDYNKPIVSDGYQSTQDLPDQQDWSRILECGTEQLYRANELILPQGYPIPSVFQVVRGSVRVEQTVELPDGEQETRVLSTIQNEGTFGEISWLLDSHATASVVANEETHLFVLDGQQLKHALKLDDRLAGRFYKYLAITVERWLR